MVMCGLHCCTAKKNLGYDDLKNDQYNTLPTIVTIQRKEVTIAVDKRIQGVAHGLRFEN